MVKDGYRPPIVGIPDPVAAVTGLSVTWTSGDRLTAFASCYNPNKSKNIAEIHSSKSQIFVLKPDILLFDPLLRKLINESCGLFVSGFSLKKYDSLDNYQSNHLLKLSRKYRSVLRESIENIQEENARFQPEADEKRYNNCIALLYNLEFIWHLTEVLYIDAIPEDLALIHITQWVRFHFPESERYARKILHTIREGDSSENRVDFLNDGVENAFPDYWDTITGLVLQGNLDLARILLQLHSQSDSDTFTFIDKIFRTMPIFSVYGEVSLPEFNLQWKLWQTNAARRLLGGTFDKYPHLKFMVQLMSGDVNSCMEELKKYCSTWYQALVAVLLYTEPTVKFYELSYHAHRFVQHYGGTANLNFCDSTVLALFELDLNSAIKKCQLASDGGWLATHLTHLLTLCGKFGTDDNSSEGDQKKEEEYQSLDIRLTLEYGTLLMCHHSLWQVGLCYLDQCNEEGRARQQILLSHIVPNSDSKAMKIIQASLPRGLLDIATSVCKVEGVKCLRRNQLGKALEWAFRSQDSAFASHLADQFLQHYVKKGVFDSNDLLDNLGSCMLICDRLTFLGKYCEFRRLYIANKLKEAATCLNDLIASRIAPKYFWLTLLTDALPLLENDDEVPFFDVLQTANLSYCLNELSSINEGCMSSLVSPVHSSVFERKTTLIRLALCKNMARAVCLNTNVSV